MIHNGRHPIVRLIASFAMLAGPFYSYTIYTKLIIHTYRYWIVDTYYFEDIDNKYKSGSKYPEWIIDIHESKASGTFILL